MRLFWDCEECGLALRDALLNEQSQDRKQVRPGEQSRIVEARPYDQKCDSRVDAADHEQLAAFSHGRSSETDDAQKSEHPGQIFFWNVTKDPADGNCHGY